MRHDDNRGVLLGLVIVGFLAVEPAQDQREEDPSQSGADEERGLVRSISVRGGSETPDRATTLVTREELQERLPRSAPDALRGEPGVYVQQTAHSQGSPYLRGLTGQQTVMFFDGVRLNNSTFRQGPNQYFFTIDSRTIKSLEVLRGSASTRYGSDALGGALLTEPIGPTMDRGGGKWSVHPRAMVRTGSADGEVGGRGQLSVAYSDKLGVLVGAGYRTVGYLRSGGRIIAPETGRPQGVPPAFAEDERTQLGTGFSEVTADARMVWQPRDDTRLSFGYYDYRQLDAPRTDKCPAPGAPADGCLRYLQQFRTLLYTKLEHHGAHAAAESITATLSYQKQHERRQLDRGGPSPTQVNGEDDVHSFGTSLKVATHDWDLAPWAGLQWHYGADAYLDVIDSEAWIYFTDSETRGSDIRGQYLDGGRYLTSGVWTEGVTRLGEVVRVRAGGRFAVADAVAQGDEPSGSASIDRTWVTGVGSGGVSVQAVSWLRFVANVDQGFRAPNLDDLTSRQQTGPGFQYENPDLGPEKSVSLEGGIEIEHPWIELKAYAFQTRIRDLIGRAPRTV
ncbi:MAG: TonB-dependent receptor, partial [Nannocystaceae bacterium]|nr:TonB-dependent receptor [Nannocystaceae bacterium]